MTKNSKSEENEGCASCLGCLLLIGLIVLAFKFPIFGIPCIIIFIIAGITGQAEEHKTSSSASSSKQSPEPSQVANAPDDLSNILQDLSNGDIKDLVTQERFRPGERVYLCHIHRLAYHEDSWNEIGFKCTVCGHNKHTKEYTVPNPIIFPKYNQTRNLYER